MLLPVFGALLFWYTQSDIGRRAVKTRLSQRPEQTKEIIPQPEQAEHFIFSEYFIVDEGLMWGKVLELLARNAAKGVAAFFHEPPGLR